MCEEWGGRTGRPLAGAALLEMDVLGLSPRSHSVRVRLLSLLVRVQSIE